MALRDSLILKPVPQERVAAVQAQAERILALLDEGKSADQEIAALNRDVGRQYEVQFFLSLHGAMDVSDFAAMAALPVPPRVADLEHSELVEIVRLIMELRQPDMHYYMELLDRNVAMPAASNLVFHFDPTPEEIVNRIQFYEVIPMPSPPES